MNSCDGLCSTCQRSSVYGMNYWGKKIYFCAGGKAQNRGVTECGRYKVKNNETTRDDGESVQLEAAI